MAVREMAVQGGFQYKCPILIAVSPNNAENDFSWLSLPGPLQFVTNDVDNLTLRTGDVDQATLLVTPTSALSFKMALPGSRQFDADMTGKLAVLNQRFIHLEIMLSAARVELAANLTALTELDAVVRFVGPC